MSPFWFDVLVHWVVILLGAFCGWWARGDQVRDRIDRMIQGPMPKHLTHVLTRTVRYQTLLDVRKRI